MQNILDNLHGKVYRVSYFRMANLMVYFSSLYLELMGSYSTKQKNRSPEKLIKCTCAFFALHGRTEKTAKL